jgi:hypothetical protein
MKKLATISIAALTLSAIYLYAWPAPNLFYAVVVLFHVGLGVLFLIGGLRLLPAVFGQPLIVKVGTLVLIVGAVLGLVLIYTGASRPYTKLLVSHGRNAAYGFPPSPWLPLPSSSHSGPSTRATPGAGTLSSAIPRSRLLR